MMPVLVWDASVFEGPAADYVVEVNGDVDWYLLRRLSFLLGSFCPLRHVDETFSWD